MFLLALLVGRTTMYGLQLQQKVTLNEYLLSLIHRCFYVNLIIGLNVFFHIKGSLRRFFTSNTKLAAHGLARK